MCTPKNLSWKYSKQISTDSEYIYYFVKFQESFIQRFQQETKKKECFIYENKFATRNNRHFYGTRII